MGLGRRVQKRSAAVDVNITEEKGRGHTGKRSGIEIGISKK